MERKLPIDNPDSLQRSRNSRAPEDSLNFRETGRHVPKHFAGTERVPELESPVEKAPDRPFGLTRRKATPAKSGG